MNMVEKIENLLASIEQDGFIQNNRNVLKDMLRDDTIDWMSFIVRPNEEAHHKRLTVLTHLLESIKAINIDKSFSIKDELELIVKKTGKPLYELINSKREFVYRLFSGKHIEILKDIRELGLYDNPAEDIKENNNFRAVFGFMILEDVRLLNEWFLHAQPIIQERILIEADFINDCSQRYGKMSAQLNILKDNPDLLLKDTVITMAEKVCSLSDGEWESITVEKIENRLKTFKIICKHHEIKGFREIQDLYIKDKYKNEESPFYHNLFEGKANSEIKKKKEKFYLNLMKFFEPDWISKNKHSTLLNNYNENLLKNDTFIGKKFRKKIQTFPMKKVILKNTYDLSEKVNNYCEKHNITPILSIFSYQDNAKWVRESLNVDLIETPDEAKNQIEKMLFLTQLGVINISSTGSLEVLHESLLNSFMSKTETPLSSILDKHEELLHVAKLAEYEDKYYKFLANIGVGLTRSLADNFFFNAFVSPKERTREEIIDSMKIRTIYFLKTVPSRIENVVNFNMYEMSDYVKIRDILKNAGQENLIKEMINESVIEIDRIDILLKEISVKIDNDIVIYKGDLPKLKSIIEESFLDLVIPHNNPNKSSARVKKF